MKERKNPAVRAVACLTLAGLFLLPLTACAPPADEASAPEASAETGEENAMTESLGKYTTVRLTTDLAALSDNERQMIPLLIDAAKEMDAAFWQQTYGDKDALLASIADADTRRFAEINYGPWDNLAGNEPFVDGAGPKPPGANVYPVDATKDEIEAAAAENPAILSLYTEVRRAADGTLVAVPYSEAYAEHYRVAAEKLRAAAELAEDAGLKHYLELRAEALETDNYQPSDLAWMDMKTNGLDIVIGPIESYEDRLFGAKTFSEAYVLVRDREWSARLARYAELLPELQRGLPVADAYKQETPGRDSDLGAYDVVYYAGDCNMGSKTIAINLPNDEEVQLQKGTRRVQLKNAMRAKFDVILTPLANLLIAEEQRANITFDAFFANTMFHEVAHGLGIKNVIDGSGTTVREAIQDHYAALEEGKADVLGLYMINSLAERGELGEVDLLDNQVTFLASIFRSIRFGSSSAHGVANLIRFNFFAEQGAFTRDAESGVYRVDPEAFAAASNALSDRILRLQGDGDYAAVTAFVDQYGKEPAELRADLDRLTTAGIPIDIIFEQGTDVLGL